MNTTIKIKDQHFGTDYLALLSSFDDFMSEQFVNGVKHDAVCQVAKRWKQMIETGYFASVFIEWYGSLKKEREDEWSFSTKENEIRSLFPKTVDVIENYGNENCHKLSSSTSYDTEIGVIYSRYPGDRDSFGWLVGVERLSFRIDEGRSFLLLASWG